MTDTEREHLREVRLQTRDLLLAHDIPGFRALLDAERDLLEGEPGMRERVLGFEDRELGEFIHALKAQWMHLGEAWQRSRNHLRGKALNQLAWTPELSAHMLHNRELPPCARCRWFRTQPPGEHAPCMHLGATPADVACAGWLPVAAP